jgi:hypothetical protein
VLVVDPAALLRPGVPQPDGTMLYELLTGRPDRAPRGAVFLADPDGEAAGLAGRHLDQGRVDPPAAAVVPHGGPASCRACSLAG